MFYLRWPSWLRFICAASGSVCSQICSIYIMWSWGLRGWSFGVLRSEVSLLLCTSRRRGGRRQMALTYIFLPNSACACLSYRGCLSLDNYSSVTLISSKCLWETGLSVPAERWVDCLNASFFFFSCLALQVFSNNADKCLPKIRWAFNTLICFSFLS